MCDITAYPVSQTVTAPLAVTIAGIASRSLAATDCILTIHYGEKRQPELQSYRCLVCVCVPGASLGYTANVKAGLGLIIDPISNETSYTKWGPLVGLLEAAVAGISHQSSPVRYRTLQHVGLAFSASAATELLSLR